MSYLKELVDYSSKKYLKKWAAAMIRAKKKYADMDIMAVLAAEERKSEILRKRFSQEEEVFFKNSYVKAIKERDIETANKIAELMKNISEPVIKQELLV